MKCTDRYYKKCVYISCRHVIMVDSINVISWIRSDLMYGRSQLKNIKIGVELNLG